MSEQSAPKTSKEGIAAIIMVGVVSIVCILACAGIAIAFILNAPW
jgi:flagellar basal body-associated protein FliL